MPRRTRKRSTLRLVFLLALLAVVVVLAVGGQQQSQRLLDQWVFSAGGGAQEAIEEIKHKLDQISGNHARQRARLERLLEPLVPHYFLPLETRNGESVRAVDLAGEGALIFHFYATHCIPCKKEYPRIAEFLGDDSRTGMTLVMVSQDLAADQNFDDLEAHVVESLGEEALPQLLLVRDDCQFQPQLMQESCEFPQTALVDSNGIVIHKEFGPSEEFWQVDHINSLLDND